MVIVRYILGAYFGEEPTNENLENFYNKNIIAWKEICKNYRSRKNVANRRKFEEALKELKHKIKLKEQDAKKGTNVEVSE